MDRKELKEILDNHAEWLRGDGGERANLRGADLRRADLREANLRRADLREANLRGADLREANLREANLWEADLRGANLRGADLWEADLWEADLRRADLRGADLRGADLWEANLRGADLRRADLRGANLREADLREANLREANLWEADLNSVFLDQFKICPEGELVGWKKLKGGAIARLTIPKEAKRINAYSSRKCRAEYVVVEEIIGAEEAFDQHTGKVRYVAGETVRPDFFDDDPRVECSHGIHFFITRGEAEAW